jgi:phage terminase large subunit
MAGIREIILPYKPRPQFLEFHKRTKRWACLICHRRAGKTYAAINDMVRASIMSPNKRAAFAFIAPYRSQAKAVVWDYLKFGAAPIMSDANESELTVTLINGSKIRLFGADNADGIRGLGFDGVYLDEYADFRPSVWGNVIRPTLSSTQGWCVFGGTPRGKNQLWDIRQTAAKLRDEWYLLELPASKSGLLPPGELSAARAQLSKDQYDQEYECSFEAAILGAFYGEELRELTEAGRICDVQYDSAVPVYTAWDLGYRDDTAIWWYQVVQDEIHIIDYYAVSGANISELAAVIKSKPECKRHYLPHDARAKTLASGGKSIIEQLAQHLGINSLAIVPNLSVQDGIQAVRQMLPRTWFNLERCADGVEALRQYQREYDEDKKAFRQTPRHDWTSHPADAFRMLAIAHREEPRANIVDKERPLMVGPDNTATLNDMWSQHKSQRSLRL